MVAALRIEAVAGTIAPAHALVKRGLLNGQSRELAAAVQERSLELGCLLSELLPAAHAVAAVAARFEAPLI